VPPDPELRLGRPSEREDPLVSALAQTTFLVMALLNRLCAEHDLSLTQLRVLAILRDRDRVRVSTLADHLGLERSTVTGQVDRGVRLGLLARTASPGDGRAVDVSLTAAGLDLADRLYAAVTASLEGLTGSLGAADQRRLAALLDRLIVASTASGST
jgi:DNA-binding MarR family transcriptional regulator